MTNVGFRDLITKTNPQLVRLGVPAREATSLRERTTGHVQNMSARWAESIGMWGGVSTEAEIAAHVGCDRATVHSYAMKFGLVTQTKRHVCTSAELGIASLLTMPKPSRDAARELGLLPVEVVSYRLAMTVLLELRDLELRDVLRWSCADLDAAWAQEGLSIALDAGEYVDFHDLDALDEIATEAELLQDDPEMKARAKARRDAAARQCGESATPQWHEPRVSEPVATTATPRGP